MDKYSLNSKEQEYIVAGKERSDDTADTIVSYGFAPRRWFLLSILVTMFKTNRVTYFLTNNGTPDFLFYPAMLVFLIFCKISVKIIEDFGLRSALSLTIIVQVIAVMLFVHLTIAVDTEDTIVPVGSTVGELFNSFSLVLMFNSITKFTSQWFGPKERIFATAILLSAFHFGYYEFNMEFYFVPNDKVDRYIHYYKVASIIFMILHLPLVYFLWKD